MKEDSAGNVSPEHCSICYTQLKGTVCTHCDLPTEDQILSYRGWLERVNKILRSKLGGMDSYDIPEWRVRYRYDSGMSSDEAADIGGREAVEELGFEWEDF